MTIIIASLVALAVGVIMVSTAAYRYITFIAQMERDWMKVMPPGSVTPPDVATRSESRGAITLGANTEHPLQVEETWTT